MSTGKKRFTEDFISKWSKASGDKETSVKKALLKRQRELLKDNPDNARLLMAHGEALADVGRYDESLEYLEKALSMDPSLPGILLSVAKSQLYSGNPRAASDSLLKNFVAVCERTGHPYINVINSSDTLADIIAGQGPPEIPAKEIDDDGPARSELDSAPIGNVAPRPDAATVEPEISLEKAEAERRKKAVATLTSVPGIGHLKAEVLYDAGFRSVEDLIDASVEELSRVEGIGLKTAQKIKIVVTFEARAEEGAENLAARDIDVLPDDLDEMECPLCKTIMPVSSTVCYECGMKFKEEGEDDIDDDLHHKLRECEDTLAIDPSDIEAWFEKGEILNAMNRNDEAMAALNEVTKLDPNYPGVWNMKAEIFTKMGEHRKAASCYKRAMELGITTAVTAPDDEMEELLQELETFQDDSEIDKEAWLSEQTKIQRELRELSDKEVAAELGLDTTAADIDDDDAELFDSLTRSLDSLDSTPQEPEIPDLDDEDIRQLELITKDLNKGVSSMPSDVPAVDEKDSEDIEYITKPLDRDVRSRPAMEIDVTKEEAERIEAVTKPLAGKSPEARKRGMTNGLARKGMTNGLAKKGFVNGTGRTNGLTNGIGRTNGLTNGVGHTNGLTNGIGRTNGLTNGVGHTNGLTNGIGRTNGLTNGVTNGLTNGVTNGLTNGLRSLRGGLTNGLTNGTGLTNGLGGRRFSYEIRKNKWKLYLIPLVTVMLLVVPMISPTSVEVHEYSIAIDGDFADWAAFETSTSEGATENFNENVDIIASTAENNNDRYLAFYVEVAGTILAGEPVTSPGFMDFFHFFIDVDNDASTGFFIDGIGADYMEEVRGWNGGVEAATLYTFSTGHDSDDWNGFRVIGSTRASVGGGSLETQIDWATFDLPGPSGVSVLVHSQSYDGYHDFSDTLISNSMTVVSAVQTSVAPQTMSATSQLLQIDMTAVNADATITGVTVDILGSILPAEISAVRVVDSGGTPLDTSTPSGRSITLAMGGTLIPAGTTASFFIEADIPAGSAVGKTVGFDLTIIDVFNGTASFSRGSSSQDVAYVDLIPAGKVIDGGFADWSTDFQTDSPADDVTDSLPNIDISRFGAANDGNQLTVYMMTSGNMMGGASVPFKGRIRVPSGSVPRNTTDADSDGDGLKNSEEPGFEYDFDNDGIPDSQDDDKDNDGILDYGSGGNDTELVQPDTKAYKYIGPIDIPPVNGYDTARIYIDADNDTSTGYAIGNIGADYLLEFRGRHGHVKESAQYIFSGTNPGSWSWSDTGASPQFGLDSRQIEAGLDISTNTGVGVFYQITSWDDVSDDSEATDIPYLPASTRAGGRPPEPAGAPQDPLYNVTWGNGSAAGDRFGWNVSWAGDVNNDGIDDLIVGAPYADYNSVTDCGAAYIFFGYTGFNIANVNYMNASAANVTIYGANAGDHFGWDVSDAGDVNGNNADIIIGAPDALTYGTDRNGSAYIFYGNGLNWEAVSDDGIWALSSTAANVTIVGEANGDKFGASVSGAGNVDGAGNDDVIVGAWNVNIPGTGTLENIFFDDFDTDQGWSRAGSLLGGATGLEFGGGITDVNQVWERGPATGVDAPTNGLGGTGNCWGTDLSADYPESDGPGEAAPERYNTNLTSPVIDGTRYSSLDLEFYHWIFAEAGFDGGQVRAKKVDESSWTLIIPTTPAGYPDADVDGIENNAPGWSELTASWQKAVFDLSSYDDSQFQIRFVFGADYSVVDAGWFIDDVYINGTTDYIGRAYLFLGDGSIPTSAANADVRLDGTADGDKFGFSVSDGGDINADGRVDILVGAPGRDEAYVYYGPSIGADTTIFSGNTGEDFGWSVAAIGDFFSASFDSVAVGAPGATNGKVYLYPGNNISAAEGEVVNDTAAEFNAGGPTKNNVYVMPAVSEVSQWDGRVNLTSSDIFYEDSNSLSEWDSVSSSTGPSIDYDIYTGYSIKFDDADTAGFQQIQEAITFPTDYVFEFYARTNGDGLAITPAEIVGLNAYITWQIEFYGGQIKAQDGSGNWDVVKSYSPNTWYHVVLVVSGTTDTYDVYVNDTYGNLQLELESKAFNDAEEELWIDTGNSEGGSALTLVAYMDEVRITDYPNTPGYFNSTTKDVGSPITGVKYTWNVTESSTSISTTNIWVDISRDGGVTWNQSSLAEGIWYTFPTEPSGSQLVFNVTFVGDGDFTPFLYDIKVEYSTLYPEAVIIGESSGDRFGYSVHGAGDINSDGYDDVIVGAPYNDNGTTDGGAVYIFNGSASSLSGTIYAWNANYTNYSMDAGSHFGWSVCKAGDIDNDGNNDVVIGAPHFQAGANTNAGKAWVMTITTVIIIPEFASLGLVLVTPVATFAITRRRKRCSS